VNVIVFHSPLFLFEKPTSSAAQDRINIRRSTHALDLARVARADLPSSAVVLANEFSSFDPFYLGEPLDGMHVLHVLSATISVNASPVASARPVRPMRWM